MTTFKKGQRVWWNDPICEESGEYEVPDSQDKINADKSESERIIRIGDGLIMSIFRNFFIRVIR